MSPDRPTGRTVTLPLVWREDELHVGPMFMGWIERRQEGWAALMQGVRNAQVAMCPTRSAAERAVEDAVIAALGGCGDADQG